MDTKEIYHGDTEAQRNTIISLLQEVASVSLCLRGESEFSQFQFAVHQLHDPLMRLPWCSARVHNYHPPVLPRRNRHESFPHAGKERARFLLESVLVVT